MKLQFKADLGLLIITLFWGASNLLNKVALVSMQPFNLISLRFDIAFIIAAVILYKRLLPQINRKTLKAAFILSVILFITYIAITYGVKYTSVSNAGFLAGLSVVCIPLLATVVFKQKLEKKLISGIVLAVIGIGLLTLKGELSIGFGDLLSLSCAFLYAVHVVATEKLTKEVDSTALAILQIGFVGLFSTVFTAATGNLKLPTTPAAWSSVLALSVFCTAVGIIIQTIAQQHTTSSRAGLIFSLEPIFSAVLAFFFMGEVLTVQGYIGAALVLLSVAIVEVDFAGLFRDKLLPKLSKEKERIQERSGVMIPEEE